MINGPLECSHKIHVICLPSFILWTLCAQTRLRSGMTSKHSRCLQSSGSGYRRESRYATTRAAHWPLGHRSHNDCPTVERCSISRLASGNCSHHSLHRMCDRAGLIGKTWAAECPSTGWWSMTASQSLVLSTQSLDTRATPCDTSSAPLRRHVQLTF